MFDRKRSLLVVSLMFPPLIIAGAAITFSGFSIAKATTTNIVLDSNNSPTLSGGEGTIVDAKGVTWEYHNASDYASGHVSLNNGGYVGVSSSSAYGYTDIGSLTVNFSSGSTEELWLLVSINGTEWNEIEVLTSETETTAANGWRYVRFYNYSSNDASIDIESVAIDYSCVGISSSEDVDSALISNVVSTSSNLTASQETTSLSPRTSDSVESIRFTKGATGSSNAIIGFGKTYTVGQIENAKIAFDMQTSNINYGKTLQMMNNTSGVGTTIDSSKHSAYVCTLISDDWYHVEVPVSALISTISGYGQTDIPAANVKTKQVNGVKLNIGNCVIDNLRIESSPTALGIYNNGTSFDSGGVYWFKVSWVGKLTGCVMSFDDDPQDPAIEQVSLDDPKLRNGSPFYLRGLKAGTVTVTATVTCGYDRHTQTISKTLTVK